MSRISALECERPTERDGAVYVVEYLSGRVKVGFSRNPSNRMGSLVVEAEKWGDRMVRRWVSPWCCDPTEKESQLIRFCEERPGAEAFSREHFAGVSYDEVVRFASQMIYAPTDPIRYAEQRNERSRFLYDYFVKDREHKKASMIEAFSVGDRCHALMIGAGVKDSRLVVFPQFGRSMFSTAIAVYLADKLEEAELYYTRMEDMVRERDFESVFELWEAASEFTLMLADEEETHQAVNDMIKEMLGD